MEKENRKRQQHQQALIERMRKLDAEIEKKKEKELLRRKKEIDVW